ncbi:MAG: hypothetical protein KAV87_00525 [Desulfobacteraceae bacterium]|nr:hypothetical protein [Desulfobacteraceae bacterium]
MVKKPALKRGVLYSFSSEDVTMISGVTEAFKKSVEEGIGVRHYGFSESINKIANAMDWKINRIE